MRRGSVGACGGVAWIDRAHLLLLCHLTEQKIDVATVDLTKLKIADLKKIIRENNLDCGDCVEKADFLRVINRFKNGGKDL